MKSSDDPGYESRREDTRKRPHVALAYEDASSEKFVRVKQEFCSEDSITNHPHSVSGCCSPFQLKTEVPCATSHTAVPPLTHPSCYFHQTSVPQAYTGLSNKTSPCFVNGSPYHTLSPLHPVTTVPTLTFPPWGLAEEPECSGTTFGSLVGVDMTTTLQEGTQLSVLDEEKKATPTKGKSPRSRSRVKREVEEDDGWEPPLWKQQLQNIVKMREARDAPVDLMGAHKNAEQTTNVSPQVRRYQVLVSLMLSSQTKDQITAQAMRALKNHGLTIKNIINTPEEDVARLIYPVGFWRKKAGYIKRVSQILKDKYAGDIPSTMDQLCSLPGVGPKMSHLVMDIAWDNTSGIAVDTHVHRISHRLGWMRKPTENPEVTRICLEKWLPKSEWRELNWLLVGFGQQRCLPTAPKCHGCLNEDICPASRLKGGGPWGKKKRTEMPQTQ